MVFFPGTLQEGIQTALQQSKLVVCFVTDGQEESQTWETEYLTDDSVASSLEKDAVVLRLEAGSQEAGYLAAIFPLPKTPTLVIIKNGELKEYVAAGTAKEELLRRIGKAFTAQAERAQGQAGESTTPAVSRPEVQASGPSTDSIPSSSTHARQTQAQVQASASASALLTEAERRRETARKEREEMERERRRREKAKQPAGSNEDPRKAKQSDAVKKASQQLAERQKQAREERARVLKLIEDDKAERRARQERERQERDGGSGTQRPDASSAAAAAAAGPSSSVTRRHDECALQVRLFDGSTIRTRFPVTATLARDVRPWIDEKTRAAGSGSGPYTFKVILTPQPNRAIDHAAGEEDQALGELGLAPSATLVLTPVDRYAGSSSAHTSLNAGLTSPVSRLVTAVLAFVANILGGIAGALGGLGSGTSGSGANGGGGNGVGDAGREREDGGADAASRQDGGIPSTSGAVQATGRDGGGGGASSSSRRIKGFQNPDDSKKDYQLYNGNSVSLLQVPPDIKSVMHELQERTADNS